MSGFVSMNKIIVTKSLMRSAAIVALACGMGLGFARAEDIPFKISIDGHQVDGSDVPQADGQKGDLGIEGVDIQVKFDGLGVRPVLNVSTFPPQVHYKSGDVVHFLASLNYAAWIRRGEVRIYDRNGANSSIPYAVVPVDGNGAGSWTMPEGAPHDVEYVLRVYDGENRYDETRSLPLRHTDQDLPKDDQSQQAIAPGYGDDRTAIRNISVFGGAVTVYGNNIPAGHEVRVMGEPVPVDNKNKFVVQRILPTGKHSVDISVLQDGQGLNFSREVTIPENEWFYVGLADLYGGKALGDNPVVPANADDFGNGVWTRGRVAFYVKGKIKGKYILTASADSGEKKLGQMFQGWDSKSAQDALKRIDPNTYYPVYGDDSSSIDDAPTDGKFYVRLEKGPSSVMWGNFHSNITGTHFLRTARKLYGGDAVYRSDAVTKDGAAKRSLDAYAALPGTVPENDVFRGTGGSAYFLKHADITIGSETVSIESRNSVTGWVVQRTQLTRTTDYTIDTTNGVVVLNNALPASGGGTDNFLVVNYEYTPAAGDVTGYVFGGRGETWLSDHLRAAVTGLREKTAGADQTMYGADLRVQATPNTYLEGEVAQSNGPGFGNNYSADGGLSLQNNATAGVTGKVANAWRVESSAALEELTGGEIEGHANARYEHYDAGFSSLDTEATTTKELWGGDADAKLDENNTLKGKYSDSIDATGNIARQGDGRIAHKLDEHWTAEPYVRYTEQNGPNYASSQHGSTGDVGSKIIYDWDKDRQAYVFAQATPYVRGTMLPDDRAGVGGKTPLSDKVNLSGEVSDGQQGVDATAAIDYAPKADDHYSLGYRLDAFRSQSNNNSYPLSGTDLGTIVLGARHKFSDQWQAFNQDNFDLFGDRHSLTQAYGVTYSPMSKWSIEGAAEIGRVYDNTINPTTLVKNPNLERQAFSLGTTYRDGDKLEGKIKGEARWDGADDGSSEIMGYLLQAGFGDKLSRDWRALGKLDMVFSDANDDTKDSQYIEGSLGFAYRPVLSDRLNILSKYQYVYDNPGAGQVGIDGTTSSPAQMSNIFSVDATYDLTRKITVGAKYGIRIGETKDRTPGSSWQFATAQLGILRADYHVVKQWDATAEARLFWTPDGTSQVSFLTALYRDMGENFKMGVGYNFGSYSDDLRDLVQDDHGVFVNLIAKF